MGYRDDREALIAERDGLRRDLEERTTELEALTAASDELKAAPVQEVARVHEGTTSCEEVRALARSRPKRSGVVAAIVGGTLAVGVAVTCYDRPCEDDSRVPEHRAADGATHQEPSEPERPILRPSLRSCVPKGSRDTFYVRAVISDIGVVTSATVSGTSLGPLVEDNPASTCVEAAALGQSLPFLRDVTVMLPIQPTLPDDMAWATAVVHASRP